MIVFYVLKSVITLKNRIDCPAEAGKCTLLSPRKILTQTNKSNVVDHINRIKDEEPL